MRTPDRASVTRRARLAAALPFLLALTLAPALSGCLLVAAGAGVGAATYAMSDAEGAAPNTPAEVIAAAEEVAAQMDLVLLSSVSSEVDGMLEAQTATDKKVQVKATRESDELTSISVRVGTFGNEELAQHILTRILRRL